MTSPGLDHAPDGEEPTVLLVEDSAEYAGLVEDMLDDADAGFAVAHRRRLATAEDALGEARPSCVLLDLGLPDASGLEGVRRLAGRAPEVPIVVLTAHADDDLAVEAMHLGAQDYLVKARADGAAIARSVRFAMGRKRTEATLAHRALHDPLTGLPNRRLLTDHLELALAALERRPGLVAALFVDLDGFKEVNDALGHDAGDEVLVEVSDRLAALLRPTDTVARLGGDEFVVVCAGLAHRHEVTRIARRLRTALQVTVRGGGRTLAVTPSIGIATTRDPGCDPAALLRDADTAMYRAKAAGGDAHAFAGDTRVAHDVPAPAGARLALELRHAVDAGELRLHLQRQVDLRDGRVVAAEALVRWAHPGRGLLLPGAFVPCAEATGLIEPLGLWVADAALAQAARRPALGVSFDVSAAQLRDDALPERLAALAARHGVAPASVTLELAERDLDGIADARARVLHRLHDGGFRLALDDFGTGHSALSTLAGLPVDELKVGRRFVDALVTGDQHRRVVGSLVHLARAVGATLVAEGVDTSAQADALRALGCGYAQGLHFGGPQPAEAPDLV